MSTGNTEDVLADVDTWRPLHWVGVVLSVGIAAVNLYIGYVDAEQAFFVVGASFLFGVGLYFTRFWHPLLYLFGLLHVGALGVLWVLSGLPHLSLGVANGVMSLALAAIALYLFLEETDWAG